jgi:hypothetical protein
MSDHRSGFVLLLLVILTACSRSGPIPDGKHDAAGAEAASPAGDDSGAGADSMALPDLAAALDTGTADAPPDTSEVDAARDEREADAATAGVAPVGKGFTWRECEGGVGTTPICGTWVWLPEGNRFSADWANGSHAFINLVENSSRVVLRRTDPSGASPGLVANYVGTANGSNEVSGTVVWSDMGDNWSGIWTATW